MERERPGIQSLILKIDGQERRLIEVSRGQLPVYKLVHASDRAGTLVAAAIIPVEGMELAILQNKTEAVQEVTKFFQKEYPDCIIGYAPAVIGFHIPKDVEHNRHVGSPMVDTKIYRLE